MTTITEAPSERRRAAPASRLQGWDHLELWVGNARTTAHLLASAYGFRPVAYAGPETGVADRASYVLEQGGVRLVVSAGLTPGHPIVEHVARHGDGVRTLAFAVDDVDAAYEAAVGGGRRRSRRRSTGPTSTVWSRRCHRRVRRDPARLRRPLRLPRRVRPWLHRRDRAPRLEERGLVGLQRIDHVVGNVEEGRLDEWVEWYERTFGFTQMRHFDAEQISTEYSALRSTVVWNGGPVVMPINEPAPGRRTSQIQEYLDAYRGPGVQHIALHTDDIVNAVDALRRRGIRFLTPPATYYEAPAPAAATSGCHGRSSSGWASSSTWTTAGTCCRSSPTRWRTDPRSSSR